MIYIRRRVPAARCGAACGEQCACSRLALGALLVRIGLAATPDDGAASLTSLLADDGEPLEVADAARRRGIGLQPQIPQKQLAARRAGGVGERDRNRR